MATGSKKFKHIMTGVILAALLALLTYLYYEHAYDKLEGDKGLSRIQNSSSE